MSITTKYGQKESPSRTWVMCFCCAKNRETSEILYTLQASTFGFVGPDKPICRKGAHKYRAEFLQEKAQYQWVREKTSNG